MAYCPAHDDKRHRSLTIRIGDNDNVWLRCHRGCAYGDIVKASGLERRAFSVSKRAKKSKQMNIVATYDYTDEQGSLLYQTLRLEPKDFRQRRPDGKRGWTWTLGGCRRVLYRLPDLLADLKRAVFVPEGEKDVERLVAEGFLATTSPMGAGAGKWLPSFSDQLTGRIVILLPDIDPVDAKTGLRPGEQFVKAKARSLLGKAAKLYVVWLPGITEGQDVSDWLDAGHTAAELKKLAAEASSITSEAGIEAIAQPHYPPPAGSRQETAEPPDTIAAGGIQAGIGPVLVTQDSSRQLVARVCQELTERARNLAPSEWVLYARRMLWDVERQVLEKVCKDLFPDRAPAKKKTAR